MRKKLHLIFTVISLFIASTGYSQANIDLFRKNIQHTLIYPAFLRQSCTPAYTNMLIDIDSKGKITYVKLSDSAPDLLRAEFNNVKSKLNLELLDEFIATKKLKDCGIIIPLFWVYGNDYCVNSVEEPCLQITTFHLILTLIPS